MQQYLVRSGQNIYDVALSIYGNIEGIFDLLACNSWLNMDTRLSYGMTLNYHEEYISNSDIAIWLRENNILVKNGDHSIEYLDVEAKFKGHIEAEHPEIMQTLQSLSPDEQNVFWEDIYSPRLIIRQEGRSAIITLQLSEGKHVLIDWGDATETMLIEGGEAIEIEHCYKGRGSHTIVIYGTKEFQSLDLSKVSGLYFPLSELTIESFKSKITDDTVNKLIKTNEKH